MKEHLNVNSIANPAGWMDTHKASEARERQREPKDAPKGETLDDTLLSANDDMFSSSFQVGEFDESLIEGMDFDAALESLKFIRQQAGTAEGRRMMGQAHREVSAREVMELFG